MEDTNKTEYLFIEIIVNQNDSLGDRKPATGVILTDIQDQRELSKARSGYVRITKPLFRYWSSNCFSSQSLRGSVKLILTGEHTRT